MFSKPTVSGRTTLAALLATGVGAAATLAIAGQVPPPGEPGDGEGDQQAESHTGVVVDLVSYLEKEEEQRSPGRQPTSPGSNGQQPPGQPGQPGEPGQEEEEDEGIDWTDGNYSENLEAGVPAVLVIEEETPWGEAETHAYVVAFDPDTPDSSSAHDSLIESSGEEIDVTGETKKERARRGLRVIMLEDVQ